MFVKDEVVAIERARYGRTTDNMVVSVIRQIDAQLESSTTWYQYSNVVQYDVG